MSKKTENKTLFKMAMKGKWTEVVELCKDNLDLTKQKITKTGATALHVAVTENQFVAVRDLVELIIKENKKEALRVTTDKGDTPLHQAATTGSTSICKWMVEADRTLIGVRNSDGETPLFLAASHGKTGAFLYLHSVSGSQGYSYSIRTDGYTSLQSAIEGEFMDLAYGIILKYHKNLVNSVNEKGYTALHLLASKPAAFPSGNKLGWFKRIIYDCLSVDLYLDDEFGEKEETDDVEKQATTSNNKDVQSKASQESKKPVGKISMFHDFIRFCAKETLGLAEPVTPCTRIRKYIKDIREIRKKHEWSVAVMNKLLELASIYEYIGDEDNPFNVSLEEYQEPEQEHHIDGKTSSKVWQKSEKEEKIKPEKLESTESAILIAAKNGTEEIVKSILTEYPVAINDRDARKKNILILAAENRHLNLFKFLKEQNFLRESIVRQMDDKGNTVLHATASYDDEKRKLWPIPGAAAQMQWEIKWFEHVKSSMPRNVTFPRNHEGKSAEEIFSIDHAKLVKEGAEWLVKTSESCSVVAALIAAVAFATSSSIPGGLDEATGKPKLEKQSAFQVFSISSLVALCFSVTALTMFLAILTSRFQERDFSRDIPLKLLVGMTSLFVSIASILVSFSSAHSLMTEDKLRYAVFPVYAVACLPISIFAVAQFPLFFDLLLTIFTSRFDFRRLNFFNLLTKTAGYGSSSASTPNQGEQEKLENAN